MLSPPGLALASPSTPASCSPRLLRPKRSSGTKPSRASSSASPSVVAGRPHPLVANALAATSFTLAQLPWSAILRAILTNPHPVILATIAKFLFRFLAGLHSSRKCALEAFLLFTQAMPFRGVHLPRRRAPFAERYEPCCDHTCCPDGRSSPPTTMRCKHLTCTSAEDSFGFRPLVALCTHGGIRPEPH